MSGKRQILKEIDNLIKTVSENISAAFVKEDQRWTRPECKTVSGENVGVSSINTAVVYEYIGTLCERLKNSFDFVAKLIALQICMSWDALL